MAGQWTGLSAAGKAEMGHLTAFSAAAPAKSFSDAKTPLGHPRETLRRYVVRLAFCDLVQPLRGRIVQVQIPGWCVLKIASSSQMQGANGLVDDNVRDVLSSSIDFRTEAVSQNPCMV